MTVTPTLADDATSTATDAWLAVVQAYNECTMTLAQRLAPLGLSLLEHEVLMNLMRSDDLTQRQLSQRCFSAKSGISMLVSRYEADGLIHRRRSAVDQRAWCLSLTPKGQAIAHRALGVQNEVVNAMADAFSDAELSLVRTRMEATANRLKTMRDD
ncbi:MarR family winged helix-turn-helix transcriptional regulator [Roseobacter sp. CCS2]|uniref:MarR family winged helix-turn-helix transcriptional regulator n=1 Tax=Roseobacter sp. CCS2 TaxID=391593 RepID=UPI0000F3F806|nr:MarR family transcriptional regulator [Roseobacter sp. CCS2]EBA10754.1 putative transcription regulator protein [Roseobacter sp. CCS2]